MTNKELHEQRWCVCERACMSVRVSVRACMLCKGSYPFFLNKMIHNSPVCLRKKISTKRLELHK
jgi:hypothetical protein